MMSTKRKQSAPVDTIRQEMSNPSESTDITISERERIFTELKEKISSAAAASNEQCRGVVSASVAAANFRREAGIYLQTLKSATDGEGRKIVPHGEWEGLFSSAGRTLEGKSKLEKVTVFDFSYETARNYIQFAKDHPEPITDIRQILRDQKSMLCDAGEVTLELPEFTPKPLSNTYSLANRLMQTFNQKFLNGCLKQEDRSNWTDEYRTGIKDSLKPIVEFYQSL